MTAGELYKGELYKGRVVEFDEERGLGTVEADDGGRFGFHCTAIADGSRKIPAGARVHFTVVPGHVGKWEAGLVDRD